MTELKTPLPTQEHKDIFWTLSDTDISDLINEIKTAYVRLDFLERSYAALARASLNESAIDPGNCKMLEEIVWYEKAVVNKIYGAIHTCEDKMRQRYSEYLSLGNRI